MKELKELNETVELMLSLDYKERFKAEYYQTKIRYEELHKKCIKLEASALENGPTRKSEVFFDQARYMGKYLHMLEIRAEIEGIEL